MYLHLACTDGADWTGLLESVEDGISTHIELSDRTALLLFSMVFAGEFTRP